MIIFFTLAPEEKKKKSTKNLFLVISVFASWQVRTFVVPSEDASNACDVPSDLEAAPVCAVKRYPA